MCLTVIRQSLVFCLMFGGFPKPEWFGGSCELTSAWQIQMYNVQINFVWVLHFVLNQAFV